MGKELAKKVEAGTFGAGGKAAAIQQTKELVKAATKETYKKYGKEMSK